MIYFGEDDWASSKPMNLLTIRNVEELSPAIRMKMGDYARKGEAGVVADYKLFGRCVCVCSECVFSIGVNHVF